MTKGEAVLKIVEMLEASTQENLRNIKSFIDAIEADPSEKTEASK